MIDIERLGFDIQLVGMLLEDSKKEETYMVFLPGEQNQRSVLKNAPTDLKGWMELLHQADLQEAKVLVNDDGKLKRAILRKSQRQIDSRISWNVYKRDGYRCRYCDREAPLTVDHLVLWEDGGPSIEENLVASCRKCNRIRGNMKYDDWMNSEKYARVSAHLPESVYNQNRALINKIKHIKVEPHVIKKRAKKKR